MELRKRTSPAPAAKGNGSAKKNDKNQADLKKGASAIKKGKSPSPRRSPNAAAGKAGEDPAKKGGGQHPRSLPRRRKPGDRVDHANDGLHAFRSAIQLDKNGNPERVPPLRRIRDIPKEPLTVPQAAISYAWRSIPYQYEAEAWRKWEDKHDITFEETEFVYSENLCPMGEEGDCLFRALSSIFTGTPDNHLYFRAEHLKYWKAFDLTVERAKGAAAKNRIHNRAFLDKLKNNNVGGFDGGMQARLASAGTWPLIEILELTSLIYRVQIFVFNDAAPADDTSGLTHCRPDQCEIRSYGPNNRTQIYLRYTGPKGGNQVQPMYPKVLRPEEFRYERLEDDAETSPKRHWKWPGSENQETSVPKPFLWRLPPALKINDVASLCDDKVMEFSQQVVEQEEWAFKKLISSSEVLLLPG